MAQIGAVQLQIKPNPNDVNFLDFVVDYDVIFTPIEIAANLPYSKGYVVIGADTPAADTGPPPDSQPAAGGNDTLAAFPNFGGGVKPGGARVVHVTDTLRVARAVADEDKPPIPDLDELQVRVELQSLPPLLPIV
ncbi:MAG: hypothetical protein M3460_17040 [Actinomycetota bacterium]|nr:hypothetical protein [Actinomycetota bacterium]